ncbi:MAG: adenosine kinase [Vezdaea aestivalis]|nr:MAG: adenosine kinase [Vezdaea aestivalis]
MAPSKPYSLVCLENPLLDIQAVCPPSILSKYSLKANDAILASDSHIPLYDELLSQPEVHLIAGGAAQNSARGAQFMLPPDSVLYIGCVGADDAADTLRKACADAGVAVRYRVDEKEPTGRCGVVITGSERSLVTQLGAANAYRIEHLRGEEVWADVKSAGVYFVGGYHFTVCPEAVQTLGRHAAKEGRVFVLGLSAPFILQVFGGEVEKVLPDVDVLIGNESEARAWADFKAVDTQDVKEIALRIANLPKTNNARKRTVVFTQGTEETVVAVQGQDEVKTFPVEPIPQEQICDTNGAGDAFAGGYLAGLVEGRDLESCVAGGHWLAGLSVRALGATFPKRGEKVFEG